jgi:AbrB family transcriptional regulator (stage V sporulation protein T)
MKATGIVRRIDDLGRVVIPKEIRRNLRIREGEPLEIFVDREGEIILKKYSPIGELSSLAREYADSIHETLNLTVMIMDRDSTIAVSGATEKDFLGKGIGRLVDMAMEERKVQVKSYAENDSPAGDIVAEPFEEDKYNFAHVLVTPIIAQGDPIGAIILWGDSPMGEAETKVAQSAAGVLSRQIEQ